jgi:hypothetical protein
MFIYIILSSILSLTLLQGSIKSPTRATSLNQTTSLIKAYMDLLYVTDQALNCLDIRNPQSSSDCKEAITNPIALCCRMISKSGQSGCYPISSQYLTLFSHTLAKAGYSLDCPSNILIGTYRDVPLPSRFNISLTDAEKIYESHLNLITVDRQAYLNCVGIRNPNSYENCSHAIVSNNAKCCYGSGNGSRFCTAVPNSTFKLLDNLFQQANVKRDCGTSG